MARPTKRQQTNAKISKAVSKLNDKAIALLRTAYSIGATDAEASVFIGINPHTISNWRKGNPELFAELDALKQTPILTARQEVVKGLLGNPEFSLKFLSKKLRKEFGDQLDVKGELGITYTIKSNLDDD